MQENERIILERRLAEKGLQAAEDDLARGIYGDAKRPIVERYIAKERRRLAATAEGRLETLQLRATVAAESQARSARWALRWSIAAIVITVIHAGFGVWKALN